MVSLALIRSQLGAFHPAGNEQKSIKALLTVYIFAEPQLSNQICVAGLQEDLPPNVLYSKEVLAGPHLLYRLLRDYLVLKGD